jgi:RHS repeat-associated protein
LVEYGAVELEYAVTGELLSRTEGVAVTQYEHDAAGRLVAVELPDGTLVEYDLDARGRRVGKRVDGAFERGWLYDGQLDPVADLASNGAVYMRFVYGAWPHVPDLIERDGVQYRVVTDHLGSVRQVIDVATGAVAQRMEYGPWGEVVVDTNPGFQPFGFAGGLYDADTGLVQFGAREYDAGLGRWISRDPVLFDGGVNLFAYAANDPVNLIDPDGRAPAGAGAAVGCALNPACREGVKWGFVLVLDVCIQLGVCFGDDHFPEPDVLPLPEPEEPVCSSPWSGPHIPLEPPPPPKDNPYKRIPGDPPPDDDDGCFESPTAEHREQLNAVEQRIEWMCLHICPPPKKNYWAPCRDQPP